MRSTRLALPGWLLASSVVACGGPARVVPPVVAPPAVAIEVTPVPADLPAITPAAGLVLMRPDATVLDAPGEGATASELTRYGALSHAYALQSSRPARVVGRAGAYYAIATNELPEGTCYPKNRGLFPGFSLTVFVHQDDLVPVLTRPIEQKFGAGLVRLDAGVALGPPGRRGGDAHHRDAAAAPLTVTLLVPDDAVGLTFLPQRAPAPAAATGDPDAELSGTCEEGGACLLWFDGDAAARISGPSAQPVKRLSWGDRSRIAIRGECVEVHATVGERALRPLPESSVGSGFGTACGGFTRDDFVVRPGTKAYWPDGRVAGSVGAERVWMHGTLSDVARGRRCFKRHPTERTSCGSEGRYLRVCFDDGDLRRIGDSPGS